jgi:hypothetical protein
MGTPVICFYHQNTGFYPFSALERAGGSKTDFTV